MLLFCQYGILDNTTYFKISNIICGFKYDLQVLSLLMEPGNWDTKIFFINNAKTVKCGRP
ncbi:unnamed protein product [Acanthoscelides obtectus]|uniref:Uncharacterized protein n=1 Tax=Acanthoscelides obtectus TaxID=200917 RepID=A0A9P0NUU2_ACAOB|nr:unnamed protein product [Acanthoscelides obtectus]CAK1661515.1 hypothetical protein AOBTE_LOCUS22659 [Acanthoscelides obtectus]